MKLQAIRRGALPLIIGLLMALVLIVGVTIAQSSPGFDLSWSAVTGGGGQRQSPNFALEDAAGQTISAISASPGVQIQAGFVGGLAFGPEAGDAYEPDDICSLATVLTVGGAKQAHTFHDTADQDWFKFSAIANKTYIIEVNNLGPQADAIIELHDSCLAAPSGQGSNAFGSTVRLEWNSTKNGDYFIKLQQFDPAFFGNDANYEVSIAIDNVPPSKPLDPRCVSINNTTLGMQWKRNLERDVTQYQVRYTKPGDTEDSIKDVSGSTTTYVELGGLTPGVNYTLRAFALDFSGNLSPASGTVQCTTTTPPDTTLPALTLQQPVIGNVYTTTAAQVTFTGLAQDSGNNLSRVQVRNTTRNVEGFDYSLNGGSDDFRVQDVGMALGDNNIELTVFDTANNTSKQQLQIRRIGDVAGAVIIVAGHNETFGLQLNIYNAANRAYRIFKSGGFSDDDIHYLAPVGQDADGDGTINTDGPSTPAAVQQALTVWAKENGRVGPGKPLFLYLIDHGFTEKFCAAGCGPAGAITPKDLDEWLRDLEAATGGDQVNVVIEACQSGSFIDRFNGDVANSLSKQGRVIITSTGRENNAYASAEGAYFSDAFFSCVADSNSLKACFDQAVSAVSTTGVNQTPWLDDNGDGVYTDGDGSVAQGRTVTRFFSSIRPVIASIDVQRSGPNGTLTATVNEGAEEVALVWAAVYPPGFNEPSGVTLNLNAPTVRLEADPNTPGRYQFTYLNGFTAEGDYRIVFYAQDRLGIHAQPRRYGEVQSLFLPVVRSSGQ
jgi:hypothetical protein